MSKKIMTIEDLESVLNENLAWRKKEMLSMKLMIQGDGDKYKRILLRLGIALLCAHFEGFIKYAANSYVKYVSNQGIPCKLLKHNFMVFNLQVEFEKCKKTDKNSVYQHFLYKYNELLNCIFSVKKDVVETHSNPSSEKIKELLSSIGVETDIFELKRNYIDKELLSNRHKVVHGERYPIDIEDFYSTFEEIMPLLDNFEKIIIEAAESKQYLNFT